jgi:hypothetical protein
MVRFESADVEVSVSYFPPEGQVDLFARLRRRDRYEEFVWSGMVGRASLARLVQLAAKALRGNAEALSGGELYYRRLGEARRRKAEEWTAFYQGKGPQPRGKLPEAR